MLPSKKNSDINAMLSNIGDDLPPISVSVGIAHGSDAADAERLFEKTDEALYESKRRGKNTHTFYSA